MKHHYSCQCPTCAPHAQPDAPILVSDTLNVGDGFEYVAQSLRWDRFYGQWFVHWCCNLGNKKKQAGSFSVDLWNKRASEQAKERGEELK